MKTHVTFRSNMFPQYDGEEDQINPGLWGKRLAEYFVEKLKGTGIRTGEIIPEDWGWYIPIENTGFRLAICCGHQGGDADEFLCFTEPATPVIRKLFKKIDATPQLEQLVAAMDKILTSDSDIKNVKWSDGYK